MLPAAARLTSSELFRRCARTGSRAGSRTLVLHHLPADHRPTAAPGDAGAPAQVGFVVSRAVGGAVVRNRVRRRLRHLVRERLSDVPVGSVLVVRALPAASAASYAELRADLGRCLQRVVASAPSGVAAAPVVTP